MRKKDLPDLPKREFQSGHILMNLLKDNRGASLIFVLGIMMFLFVICASVLVAAGNNLSYMINQRDHGQIQAIDESIHKTIMFGLQDNINGGIENTSSLGWQLARALFDAADEFGEWLVPVVFTNCPVHTPNLDPACDECNEGIVFDYDGLALDDGRIRISRIELMFIDQRVDILEAEPGLCLWVDEPEGIDEDGDPIPPPPPHLDLEDHEDFGCIPRIPKEAWVDVALQVTVDIRVNFVRLGTTISRTVRTRAVYSYEGGHLTEDEIDEDSDDEDYWEYISWLLYEWEGDDYDPFEEPPLNFNGEVGSWVLESHETIAN